MINVCTVMYCILAYGSVHGNVVVRGEREGGGLLVAREKRAWNLEARTNQTYCVLWLRARSRCRNSCERVPTSAENAKKKKVHMYAQKCIYTRRSSFLRLYTSAEARTRRPTGEIARRIPPFRGRTPTYQHNTYSNLR